MYPFNIKTNAISKRVARRLGLVLNESSLEDLSNGHLFCLVSSIKTWISQEGKKISNLCDENQVKTYQVHDIEKVLLKICHLSCFWSY